MAAPSNEPLLRSGRRAKRERNVKIFGVIFLSLVMLLATIVYVVIKNEGKKQVGFKWPPPSASVMGTFDRFAIATDHTLCAHAGKTVILAGGNAIEASIAAMFCLGATNPQSSGLGGGFLMTLYNASTGRCVAIDAREEAPRLAHQNMFVNNTDASKFGFLASAVPGELAGFWEAYRRFGSGKVRWDQLVQPTIDLVESGVPVSKYLAEVMALFEHRFRSSPTMKLWMNPATNSTYKEGETMPRARLLKTLKKLAAAPDPVQLFYHGEMAESIEREMRANGGIITRADLAAYRVRVHETPLVAPFRNGMAMCGGPPPSGFAVTQLIVNIINKLYPNSTADQLKTDPKVYHHFLEAQKFAYSLRSKMSDAKFVPAAGPLAAKMTTPEYVDSIVAKITDEAHESSYYSEDKRAAAINFGTSHVSALDADGNAVSVTTTINRRFGASVESEELGIIWNDEMGDFSTPGENNVYGYAPSEANFIVPGKRPQSSMCPLIVYNEKERKVRLATGASGGAMIISATAKSVIRSLIFGENIKEAIDAPLLHNQFTPDIAVVGKEFPKLMQTALETKHGQKFKTANNNGLVQAVLVNPDGKIEACGDARRKTDQTPAGF